MPGGKLTTHRAHSTRHVLYLVALRRLPSTVGTATTVFPFTQMITTFITPWGRYRYKMLPQGCIASGDGYSRRFDEIVSHIPNKTKCIDDTLLWGDNLTESFFQAVEWLDICGHHGIILNPDKFVFGSDTLEFAGVNITSTNVRPCKKYLDIICDFPTPTNITDVCSWFGLINQVSNAFAATEPHATLSPITQTWDTLQMGQ
ncbi:Transposon Ty3-I Gag-Pol polyprotein [Acropora cervicornis]|uniref:Transposon Ty3-I Gag-Pol polyprotein n=1 Tax=Acropora cervicornis TaxID=6130 RepID=A0AAD9QN33_ACRCE|nr:Transposon Ty3-I Gag-Pol polyprotein [Acropora cervicornis]